MKITQAQLRRIILEETAQVLDETSHGRSAHDYVVDVVEIYQGEGLQLAELQDAIRAAWMTARRASAPVRTTAQKAAAAKKSAATRSANKAFYADADKRWAESQRAFQAALERELTPRQLKAYKKIEQDYALSGSKDSNTRDILRQVGADPAAIEAIMSER